MNRLFQILKGVVSIQTLIKVYIKTGNNNEQLYDDIKKKWAKHNTNLLLSLDSENDITQHRFIIQTSKTSKTNKDLSYSVAIHTNLSYVLFEVIKTKSKYRAYIRKVITHDLQDYQDIYQNIFPSLFMEFVIYPVFVTKAFDCEVSYINKDKRSMLLKGIKQNICVFSNNMYDGESGLITVHGAPN